MPGFMLPAWLRQKQHPKMEMRTVAITARLSGLLSGLLSGPVAIAGWAEWVAEWVEERPLSGPHSQRQVSKPAATS
eukprot:scaffold249151_cov19-Tisochrysis_lutea.AAC.1